MEKAKSIIYKIGNWANCGTSQ